MDTDVAQSMENRSAADSRPICRLCLGEEQLEDIFDPRMVDLQQWMSDYFSIAISPNDGLSHSICVNCQVRLMEFRDYQQRCTEVQSVPPNESSMVVRNGDTTFTLKLMDPEETVKKEHGLLDHSQQICRLCSSRECVDDVFKYGDLHRWILDYLLIEISSKDNVNRFCCAICKIRLEEFRNFQLRCLEVQTQLLNSKCTVVKVEPEENTAKDSENPWIVKETHGERSIQCKVCHKVITGTKHLADRLRYHMVMHGPKKYACTVCEKAFVKSSHLKDHMRVHFKKYEEPVECPVCHNMFKNVYALRVHKISHGAKKHVCPICGKAYAVRQSFKKHVLTHNSKPTFEAVEQHSDHPFRCDTCFKLFKNQASLRYHNKIHQPERKVCVVCNAAFIRAHDFNDHMATHSASNETEDGESHIVQPFKCNMCPKAYKRRCSLRQHIQTHGPNKYTCTLCNKQFAEKRRLNAHMQTHNKYGEESEAMTEVDLDEFLSGVPFECKLCPRVYHLQKDLSKHMSNLHRRNKSTLGSEKDRTQRSPLDMQKPDDTVDALHPFKCTVCRKVFKTKAELVDHMRSIRAKMSIQCSICKQRFGSSDLLDQHIKDAIHAEGSGAKDSGNNVASSMETNDMFEAGEIKVEIHSDNDD